MQKNNKQEQCKHTNYREQYKDTAYLEQYKIHHLHGIVQLIQATGTNLK
jgi:hypothetical protein